MKYLLIVPLFLFMLGCNYSRYNNSHEQQKTQKRNTAIIKDSISSYIISNLKGDYTPYSFNKLITNKPKPFFELDTLYFERKLLVRNKTILNYDSLLSSVNQKIKLKKTEINESKVFHTYDMTHIYTLENSLKITTLYENKFSYYPNFKLKDVSTILSTVLSAEEKDLFEYFSLQNPLYESGSPAVDLEVNNDIYNRFNYALANEVNHKEKLLHTILHCVKYIRQYNNLNTEKMAEELVEVWLYNHNINTSEFKPKFGDLVEIKEEEEIVSYTMEVSNKKESNIKSMTFDFDLNLVILNTKMH